MDSSAYNSQQEAITRKAKEKGIALEILNAVFDQKIDAIVHDYPGTRPAWRLGRAEYLVWEHFFPNEPFPGTGSGIVIPIDSGLSKMEKNIQKDTDSYRPTDRTAMNMDWVHDKYRPESPKRKETIESRLPDYNCGPKRPMDQVDSYKPALGSDGDSRDIDSYRPLSRNRQERHDHGRYGVDKPTLYHTLLDHIVEKAFTEGVSSDSFFGAYYRCGKKAKDDKPTASAYWLLWRQECMIWKHLFPEEGFIGIEPKLKPTTWDTETTRFSLMDSSKLWRMLKSSPAYGRLTKENGGPRSVPTGPSSLPKKPPATSNSIQGGQNNLQPSQLVRNKAVARKVSAEKVQAAYEEKQKLVKSHFSDQSKEWQHWFVEATLWGHLFTDAPFPRQEPRLDCTSGGNRTIVTKNYVFSYAPQEKVMEQMAIKKGIRREFYQYLNMTRHDAIAVYPQCTCNGRHLFADRLTWRKFFKEAFPADWPRPDHAQGCRAGAQNGVSSIQIPLVTAPLKSPVIKSEERGAIGQGTQRSTAAVKAPPKSPVVKTEASETAVLPPNPSEAAVAPRASVASVSTQTQLLLGRPAVQHEPPNLRPVTMAPPPQLLASNVHSHTAQPRLSPRSFGSSSTQNPASFSSFQGQENNIKSSYGQSDPQPRHSQGLTLASYQAQETKAQSAARELSASPTQESAEISAPLSIMTALAEARKNKPMLPDGVLVTQNMDVTVCNSETVVQMFRCLRAEDAAFITSISNGLKCHFRYKRNWNADLLLWVEPFTLGDTAAFSGGHLFLRGWVQRNLGFGVVQPSFYWHEIQSTASFKYVATAPAPISETVSPTKSKSGNITSSTENLDSSTNISDPKADAVLVIRGDYIENVPCSRAALKNLAFSFVVDSSKEKVEQRLRCTFSLVEAKGPEKTGERELDLVVKRLLGTEKGEFEKATRFLRAWALRAIQSMPYKASVFLVSPEGLHILGQSPPPVMPANGAPGKRLDDPENTRSPYSALDLDLMLSEETAKVEGSSRLVLDEVAGAVVTLRELLKKTLYRASAKILESSAIVEDEDEDEEDDEMQLYGTDGQMKDMGGGKFVVVKTQRRFEVSGLTNGKRKIEEDLRFGERAEKRVCNSSHKIVECEKPDRDVTGVDVTGGIKEKWIDERPAILVENGSTTVETSETVNGKRKAKEAEPEDCAEKKVCV